MNHKVFISHSNMFIEITKYFGEFLKSRGLIPIVVEFMPSEGHLWSVEQKVTHFMGICDSAIVIATPDEVQDDKPVPRMDVVLEVGRLKEKGKKVVILKERSVVLPKSLDVVYVLFDLGAPSNCLDRLDTELASIFWQSKVRKIPFKVKEPRHRARPAYTLDGKALVPEQPDLIEEEVKRIFLNNPKEEQSTIVSDVIALLESDDDDTRWVASLMLEEVLEYDASLVPREAILKMSRDASFSVRSAASVCLFKLANIAPSCVPLDVIVRLASIDEDWYVFTPALATLKTLSHRMPRALDVVLGMAHSDNEDEAEYGVAALLDIVSNDPGILGGERLQPLDKSPSKYVRKTAAKIKAALKQVKQAESVIRYSPF
jgi:CAP12/Pycsar effector protein, TIR domain